MTLTFGSLFNGIHGFGLGFERAGMSCTWVSEIDKHCNTLVANKYPELTNLGDVKRVSKRNARPVDVICGGFPCQDLSVAGKRAGLAGERSGLWFEFHRVVKMLKPRWVVVENVPGLLSSADGNDFLAVIRGLDQLGYGVAWRVLDAQFFGVAQRRRRVFVVASLGSTSAVQVLFEPESLSGDSAPSREAGQRVAATLRQSFKETGGVGYSNQELFSQNGDNLVRPDDIASALKTGESQHLRGDGTDNIVAFKKRGGFGWSETLDIAGTLESEGGTHQGGPERVPIISIQDSRTMNKKQNGRGWNDDGVAYTIDRTGSQGIANFGVRRLTPTECERLQGFPDGWTEGFADSVRYRMLGNAVAVPVVEWIGKRIVAIEKSVV